MLHKFIKACKQYFSSLCSKKADVQTSTPSLKWAHAKVTDVLQQLEDISFWSCQPTSEANDSVRTQIENSISRASTLRDELLIQIRERKETRREQ